MRYKPKNIAALQVALGGLPDRMRVEVDADIGASPQFVSEAGSATPELAVLAGTAAGSPSGRPQPIAGVETAVLTPTKFYERRAKDCVQAAGRTDNPKHRDHLLNLAYEWAQRMDGRARSHSRAA